MKTVVYRKSDLRCVSTIPSNKTAEGDINITVIPNFGGSIEDYAVIETDETNFHLEMIEGVVTVVIDPPAPPPEPAPGPEEKIAQLEQQLNATKEALDFLLLNLMP
jgi:hypothetical protein